MWWAGTESVSLHVEKRTCSSFCVCYHMEFICYNPGYFMLHVLRTAGATGWLVSQKVLSLLWLAILSPGYYSNLCVCVCIACSFWQIRGLQGLTLMQLCLCCSFCVLKCMCYFIDQNMLNERVCFCSQALEETNQRDWVCEYGVSRIMGCVWFGSQLVFLLPQTAAANLCVSWSILRSPVYDNLCSDINTEFLVR